MDYLKDLATLGPALGSVVVLGYICWRLLQLVDRFGVKLEEHTKGLDRNTNMIERVIRFLEQKI